jgi:tetratricopeptide (TPR) repeat protein
MSAVSGLPGDRLRDALAQLVQAELIFQRGSPPDATFLFKHGLVQDAVYASLVRSRRQQLHARITDSLEGQFPEVVIGQPQLMARHCAEAGLVEKAVGYCLKAGRQAIERWAMAEAVAQLQKGLALLSGMPDAAARQEQELDLQIALGNALVATKGYAATEPGELFARARQLCEQLNKPPQLLPVLFGQFFFRLVRGDLEQAEHHAEEMRQLAETRNDDIWKRGGFQASGNICCFLGKFIDARVFNENALSLWDSKLRATAAATPEDPRVSTLLYLFRTLMCLGYLDQARSLRNEALADAERVSPYNLVYASCLAWYGDWAIEGVTSAQTMLRSAEKVLAISTERGFPLWIAVGNIMRGWCLGATGHPVEGIPLILKGLEFGSAIGLKLMTPFFLTALAEVYGMAGQPDKGLNRLAEAATVVGTTKEYWAEAEMHRLRGTLLLSMHEHAAAEDCYHQALAVARRQSAKFWELRAAIDLARLWRDQRNPIKARDLLAPVDGWFTEGFDTVDLKQAKALLDGLGGRPSLVSAPSV